jgi:hypothetical protein
MSSELASSSRGYAGIREVVATIARSIAGQQGAALAAAWPPA